MKLCRLFAGLFIQFDTIGKTQRTKRTNKTDACTNTASHFTQVKTVGRGTGIKTPTINISAVKKHKTAKSIGKRVLHFQIKKKGLIASYRIVVIIFWPNILYSIAPL